MLLRSRSVFCRNGKMSKSAMFFRVEIEGGSRVLSLTSVGRGKNEGV